MNNPVLCAVVDLGEESIGDVGDVGAANLWCNKFSGHIFRVLKDICGWCTMSRHKTITEPAKPPPSAKQLGLCGAVEHICSDAQQKGIGLCMANDGPC